MRQPKLPIALFTLLCLVSVAAQRLCADITVVPLTSAQVGQDPYKFNGVVTANDLIKGSGAVIRYTNIVLSAAHVAYGGTNVLDPWLGEVRWFWKYHASAKPTSTKGKLLRGYAKFAGYQFAVETAALASPNALAWDLVAYFAYEGLAEGESGAWWTNGYAALRTSSSKMITGYPSALYPAGDPNENKMHVAGPFPTAFSVVRGAYLEANGVAVGAGTSGGPVWVQDTSGEWRMAGVAVSTRAKALGAQVNTIGVRAIDDDAWSLVTDAIRVTQPPNDQFEVETVLTGYPTTVIGNNVGATKETDEPDHAEKTGGKSVWWTWTAPADVILTLDTAGSTFDTLLAVYTGNSVTNLTLIASDDNSGGNGTSKVTFAAVADTAYHIAVDGLGMANGNIVLNFTPPPPNDAFAASILIKNEETTVMGSNVSASKETGEPNHAGLSGAQSVWWKWIAPINGPVTIDTIGSSFDTLLAVYIGNSVSGLTAVAGDNDGGGSGASRLTFSGKEGTVYHIAVDGFRGAEGNIVLNIWRGMYITRQPQPRTVTTGGNVIFGVGVVGAASPKYQWRKNGTEITEATNSTFAISNIQSADAGAYSVLVTDASGSVESAKGILTVRGPYTFSTLAGSPPYGSTNGMGSAGRFYVPRGICADRFGNLIVADTGNQLIRRVTPSGMVTTPAGSAGEFGRAEGAGKAARFTYPTGVAVDGVGRIYVADFGNNAIRRFGLGANVAIWAGSTNGIPGSTDGIGTAARFAYPSDVAVDNLGNVYVADTSNHTIRKITPAGVVSTLAGSAQKPGSGDGAGSMARFSFPQGVAVDSAGNVYVADSGNDTIRMITPDGLVSTVAGLAGNSGSVDGVGSAALFGNPLGITVDAAGIIYVAEDYNQTIRKIGSGGVVTTLAGLAGVSGSEDGTGQAARFSLPSRMTVDAAGNLFVADAANNTIRKITPQGVVTTLAGKASVGVTDGIGDEALFSSPIGAAVDSAGNVYVADFENQTIRKIAPKGAVSTLAGMPRKQGSSDGTGSDARFDHPRAVALDSGGNLYVTDLWNHTIRKITQDGVVSTFAGLAGSHGSTDGTGADARFIYPFGVAVDASGSVYVTDGYNHTIRRISASGVVKTLAGTAGKFGYVDGAGIEAQFDGPDGIAADAVGNLFVADYGNHVIRKITPEGMVSTFAGLARVPGSTDGMGSEARFRYPLGLAVDKPGFLYVADRGNNTIRMITPDGVVSTLAGSAKELRGSADGVGLTSRFYVPSSVAVDTAGNLYVIDTGNNTIRKGSPADIIVAGPRPSLRIALFGENLVLSWPTNVVGFVLEVSPNLIPSSWSPVSITPAAVGENYSIEINVSTGRNFYRLRGN